MLNRRKVLLPVGLATAAVTTVGGFAPALAAPDSSVDGGGTTLAGDPTEDGTFESCSAYFGFGKDLGAIDLVQFDVTVSGPAGSPLPSVENGGVAVLLEIENTEGDVFECEAEELTEQQWENEYGHQGPYVLPEYPGSGHYIFPSASYTYIPTDVGPPSAGDTIGQVEKVGFKVVHVETGYELVSPLGVRPLESQIFPFDYADFGVVDPRVSGYIATVAGADAAAAFEEGLGSCDDDPYFESDDPDLVDAAQVLVDLTGFEYTIEPPVDCGDLGLPYLISSYVLSVEATTEYTQLIQLTVPTTPPTPTTTPTTTPTSSTATPGASPAVLTPRFAG